jgi:PAS domain S-box-containing protein
MSEDSYIALRQSEIQFRALFEQMALGVSKVDVRTGRLVLVNQHFADLLGYAREELLALDLQTITHPDDQATVHQHMQELASSQVSSYAMVRRYVRKDGGVVWANVTVSRLWSEGDEPDFAITTIEDVTERKLAEERTRSLLKQVQADKDLQDRLLSNMSDEVWFADTTGHFTLANPSACKAFALENIGNTDVQRFAEGLQVFRPDGSPRPVEEAPPLRALAGETVTNQEEIVRLPLSGELRYRQVNSSPMRDAQGTIIGCVSVVRDITERKRAEEALASSERFLSNILEQGPASMWISDSEGTLMKMNQACRQLFGITDEEGVGKYNLLKDNLIEAQGFMGLVRDVFERGEIARFTIDYDVRRVEHIEVKAATHRILDVVISPIKDMSGKVTNVLVQHNDITERKRAEEALAESEKKLRTLFETMSEGIVYEDHDGKIISANPAAERLLGLSLDQMQGRTSLDPRWKAIHEDGSPFPGETHSLSVAAKTGKPATGEVMGIYNPKSGAYVWLSVNSTPEFLPGEKEPFRAYAVFRDIAERKRAEEALAESEKKLRTLFETMSEGIVYEDHDGKIISANPAAERLLGLSLDQMQGRTSLDPRWKAIHEDGSPFPGETHSLRVAAMTGKPGHDEIQGIYNPQLSAYTWLSINSTPEFLPGEKEPFRAYAVFRDITERKRAEEEIRTLNAELEERVRRRTAELSAANKELEAFSYSVSHDLHSPLRSIDGFSQAFLEDYGATVPPEGREDLERVRRATQRMGQLIDDMLALSRVTRSQMHVEEIDMSALAAEVAERLVRENPQRDVQLSIEPGMTATGDRQLLIVVLSNLLGNAWKFTSKREHAHVSMGTERDLEHGLAFFVRDDGAGFDPRYKDKLFVAFQRLHSLEEFPGTGIGLATVERVVRRYGGDVWAKGEIDRGATFYFTIPDLYASIPTKGEQQ